MQSGTYRVPMDVWVTPRHGSGGWSRGQGGRLRVLGHIRVLGHMGRDLNERCIRGTQARAPLNSSALHVLFLGLRQCTGSTERSKQIAFSRQDQTLSGQVQIFGGSIAVFPRSDILAA